MSKKSKLKLSPEVFKKLQDEYKQSLPQKLENIRTLVEKLKIRIEINTLKSLRIEIYNVAGSSGAYGLTPISETCILFGNHLVNKIEEFERLGELQDWIDEFNQYLKEIEDKL